jgi:hypothetical protein
MKSLRGSSLLNNVFQPFRRAGPEGTAFSFTLPKIG